MCVLSQSLSEVTEVDRQEGARKMKDIAIDTNGGSWHELEANLSCRAAAAALIPILSSQSEVSILVEQTNQRQGSYGAKVCKQTWAGGQVRVQTNPILGLTSNVDFDGREVDRWDGR